MGSGTAAPKKRTSVTLSDQQIIALRRSYADGEGSLEVVGRKYGISHTAVWLIVKGLVRGDLPVLPMPDLSKRLRRKAIRKQGSGLSGAVVRQIREEFQRGGCTEMDLSRKYQQKPTNISALLTGKSWRGAGGPLVEKGAAALRGSSVPWAKLDDQKVKELLRLWRSKEMNQPQLALKYQVSQGLISAIIHRRKWRHVRLEEADGSAA